MILKRKRRHDFYDGICSITSLLVHINEPIGLVGIFLMPLSSNKQSSILNISRHEIPRSTPFPISSHRKKASAKKHSQLASM